jgi:hypothetical protein
MRKIPTAFVALVIACAAHAVQYRLYRAGCGREARLAQLWGEGHS